MKYLALLALAVLFMGAGYWFYGLSSSPISPAIATSSVVETAPLADVPKDPPLPLGPTYTNKKFRFSLAMPEEFRAEEMAPDEEGVSTVLLQNKKGDGVQILITRVEDAPTTLSVDDIRASIPDMRIADVQTVEIGEGASGVAFLSDNEAFGGRSREVWFYFRGNLYQISTYARLDPLLKSMFGTWKFF